MSSQRDRNTHDTGAAPSVLTALLILTPPVREAVSLIGRRGGRAPTFSSAVEGLRDGEAGALATVPMAAFTIFLFGRLFPCGPAPGETNS